MDLGRSLLLCADVYCQARNITRPTLSGRVFKDSRTLDRVANGGSLTVRSYQRCMTWLADNWPDGADWPADVDRPGTTAPQEAA